MAEIKKHKTNFIGRAWRWLRARGIANYIILLGFPLFGKPLHFIKGATGRGYARARIGWALPLAASGVWVFAMNTIFHFLGDRQFEVLAKNVGATEAYKRMNIIAQILRYETILIIFCGIVSIAFIRWNYHRLARIILKKWWENIPIVPFKYYLVSTSSSAFLIGLGSLLLASLIRYFNGDIRPAVEWLGTGVVNCVLILYFLAFYVSIINRKRAVIGVYGPIWWLVDFGAVVVLFLMLLLVGFVGGVFN
ncbi:hypothetical protein [uncultured Xanthomonas sp.]|uniref:hypothetical protein n=1 Tax=uncultured Xanthomonas sp. TaxID=152831 RepID=UPI0025CC848C|nr:hypothetical protein [uncultured Xanthomonas sp.]